jgi:predicted metal-dependent peptidase
MLDTKIKTAEDKILKAKIKLQSKSPFFSYLSYFLKIKQAKNKEIPDSKSMSVDITGNIYYNPEWIVGLSDDEVMGVLCHEIGHLAFLHLIRRHNRNKTKWNITTDLAINSMLIKNGFSLPKGGLIPDYNDNFEFPPNVFGKKIKIHEVHKKTAEDLFDELPELEDDEGEGGWDIHIEGECSDEEDDKDGKGKGKCRQLTPAELKELEEKWKDRIEEALMNSKARGNVPMGMERVFEQIRKSQISWRVILERVIQKAIPRDITWARRSKKSIACNTYLPSVLKERVDVVISIDTSGSIGQKELTDFVSEIVGMARAFQSAINMRLITHDSEVQDDYDIRNGNIAKIKQIKIKGGGGTSHEPVFEYVKEKMRGCKVLIAFTDGYSDLENFEWDNHKYPFEKVFVLNKDGSDEQMKGKGCKVIQMKE